MMAVICKRIGDHHLPVPTMESAYSTGVDLRAHIPEGQISLMPGEEKLISTGFAMAVPHMLGMYLMPRSGLGAKQGLVLGNLVGVIDPDYRGPVKVALWYRRDEGPPIVIKDGDRICQAVLLPRVQTEFIEAEELDDTERGTGGFGSTGTA